VGGGGTAWLILPNKDDGAAVEEGGAAKEKGAAGAGALPNREVEGRVPPPLLLPNNPPLAPPVPNTDVVDGVVPNNGAGAAEVPPTLPNVNDAAMMCVRFLFTVPIRYSDVDFGSIKCCWCVSSRKRCAFALRWCERRATCV
jgi:hypothetical protein